MSGTINQEVRLLAATAYGEASTADDSQEIGGIAFAVANRCRAWDGKTVTELRSLDPNYLYAWNGSNARFNAFMAASNEKIQSNTGMRLATEWARRALANEGPDPSNGAFWWDGLDFKTNYIHHPKVRDGFKWSKSSDNIFAVPEQRREIIVRWRVRNRRTGQIVDGSERGRYDSIWMSTSAAGSTIFWLHNPDYLSATGGKSYK